MENINFKLWHPKAIYSVKLVLNTIHTQQFTCIEFGRIEHASSMFTYSINPWMITQNEMIEYMYEWYYGVAISDDLYTAIRGKFYTQPWLRNKPRTLLVWYSTSLATGIYSQVRCSTCSLPLYLVTVTTFLGIEGKYLDTLLFQNQPDLWEPSTYSGHTSVSSSHRLHTDVHNLEMYKNKTLFVPNSEIQCTSDKT